jgi:hypothetical protein
MFADNARRCALTTLSSLALLATVVGCGAGVGRSGAPATSNTTAYTAKKPLGAGHQRLDRGTQVLDLSSRAREHTGLGRSHLPKIALTVPDGWFNYDGWALLKGRGVSPLLVGFWDVAGVYPTPCKWAGKPLIDPGRSVDGLASALARQPRRNATAPTDVSLGGFRGKYLRWSVPTDIAFDEKHRSKALFPGCDEQTFQSWTANGWAGDRYEQAPGQVDMLWILNVHGERLVVDSSYLPEATAAERAELARVVHSIRFIGR